MYMKRALAFVLLVVLLFVSFLPCADDFAIHSSEKTMHPFVKSEMQNNHQQDVCPPFCQCHCCSIVTIYHSFQTGILPLPWNDTPYAFQQKSAVVRVPHDIWQPPQL